MTYMEKFKVNFESEYDSIHSNRMNIFGKTFKNNNNDSFSFDVDTYEEMLKITVANEGDYHKIILNKDQTKNLIIFLQDYVDKSRKMILGKTDTSLLHEILHRID